LIDLGIASELGWPMLQISELAAKEELPIKFLEQIFAQLKAAGYVGTDPVRQPNVLCSLLMPR